MSKKSLNVLGKFYIFILMKVSEDIRRYKSKKNTNL